MSSPLMIDAYNAYSQSCSYPVDATVSSYINAFSIVSLEGDIVEAPSFFTIWSSISELNGDLIPAPDYEVQIMIDELYSVAELKRGWDGEKACAASPLALKNAAVAITQLYDRPSPHIALLDSGGILFEWAFVDITYQVEWFNEGGGEYSAFSKDALLQEGSMPEVTREIAWRMREFKLSKLVARSGGQTALPT